MDVRGDELIIVQHDRLAEADSAIDPQRMADRQATFELDFLLGFVDFYPVQTGDEIEVPVGAAIFAVGGGAQADFLLLRDRGCNATILDLAQRVMGHRAGFPGGAGGLQFLWPQQAADVIGAEGWAWHELAWSRFPHFR